MFKSGAETIFCGKGGGGVGIGRKKKNSLYARSFVSNWGQKEGLKVTTCPTGGGERELRGGGGKALSREEGGFIFRRTTEREACSSWLKRGEGGGAEGGRGRYLGAGVVPRWSWKGCRGFFVGGRRGEWGKKKKKRGGDMRSV